MVCLPVQQEIDNQKKRGNDRVGRRARKTNSSLFRKLATGEKEFQLIRESSPSVKLLLEAPSIPSSELSETLDYSRTDDAIVGCLHRFLKDHPKADARLLTHDTGPLMVARSLGLESEHIPEPWLLLPEKNEVEKENSQLRNEIDQLKNAEPKFTIDCIDGSGKKIEELELVTEIYEQIEEREISEFLETLKRRFPIAIEFNMQEPKPTGLGVLWGQEWHFEQPSDEHIAKYTEQEYPAWLEKCETFLSGLHETLQQRVTQPAFAFEAKNLGTRPGNDALIIIRASGQFMICPPPYDEDFPEDHKQLELCIPTPPAPPRGKWVPVPDSAMDNIYRIFGDLEISKLAKGLKRMQTNDSLPIAPYGLKQPQRDPNGFYYKPTHPEKATERFEVECKQWRHGTSSEPFHGDIFPNSGLPKSSGALECEIHAENLSKPVKKKIPVRITVECVNARQFAKDLIDQL